jgi:hypothetical protein
MVNIKIVSPKFCSIVIPLLTFTEYFTIAKKKLISVIQKICANYSPFDLFTINSLAFLSLARLISCNENKKKFLWVKLDDKKLFYWSLQKVF